MNAGFAALLVGLALCWLAIRLYQDWPFLTRRRVSAFGSVVDHGSITGEGGATPFLIIRFEADNGQTVDVRAYLGPLSHQLEVGSAIGVEYPAGYPKRARPLGSRSFLLDYGVCFVILAILIGFMINPKWMP